MKTRVKPLIWLTVAIFALMSALTLTVSLSFGTSARAAGEQTAQLYGVTTKNGPNWQASPFGNDGKVILSATGNSVYTDLYDGAALDTLLATQGKTANSANTWITPQDAAVTLKANAPIAKWAYGSSVWRAIQNAEQHASLYAPDTEEQIRVRNDGWKNNIYDTSFAIEKASTDTLYLTVYVFAGDPANVTDVKPLDVYLFGTPAKLSSNGKDSVETELAHYTGAQLAKAVITASGSYVTFKLEGAGEFQVVATKGTKDGALIAGTQTPCLGGFFLDKTEPKESEPIPSEKKAEFVATDSAYASDWQASPYGQDGKAIFTSTAVSPANSLSVYSDLYSAGLNTVTTPEGWGNGTNSNPNNWLSTAMVETSPLARWAHCGRAFRSYGDGESYRALNTPDGKVNNIRTDGWNTNLQDTSIVLDVKEDGPLYVTVYVYSGVYLLNDQYKINEQQPVDLYVFDSANLKNANPKSTVAREMEYYGDKQLCKTTITASRSYMTFKLEGAGTFQIVATKGVKDGAVVGIETPMIGGFFLDKADPASVDSGVANVTADTATKAANWQSVYGKGDYMLFDYNDGKLAHTQSGAVALTEQSTAVSGEEKAYEFATASGALANDYVSKAGMRVEKWDALEDTSAQYGTLFTSNMLTDPQAADGKIDAYIGGETSLYTANMAFTVKADATLPLYVTVFGNNSAVSARSESNKDYYDRALFEQVPLSVGLYNGYHTPVSGIPAGKPLQRAYFTQGYKTHYFVTFEITAAGDYTVSASAFGGVSQGSITALFFDTARPTPAAADYKLTFSGCDKTPVTLGNSEIALDPLPETETEGFLGWFLGSDMQSVRIEKIPANVRCDLTVYANVKPYRSISFGAMTNGQNTAANEAITKALQDSVVTLEDGVPDEHYAFGGWYTSADFDAQSKVSGGKFTVGEQNVTFYAKFDITGAYTITYVLDGGANAAGNPTTFFEGEGTAALGAATKEGYAFDGWFLGEDFDVQLESIPTTLNENVTLYAKFSKIPVSSTIEYVLDGGVNAGNNFGSYVEGDTVILFPAEKEGYVFDGWYTDVEFTQKVEKLSAETAGNVTLYAKFVLPKVQWQIEYRLNGGVNGDGNPLVYTEGETVELADATKEGCIFDGWYTDAGFTHKVTSLSAETTGNVTLYARFAVEKKPNVGLIVGVTAAVAVVLAAAVSAGVALFMLKRKKTVK